MSSDELKKQLLQQKLFRNLKSKQKTSKSLQDKQTLPLKTSISSTKAADNVAKGTETDLTKWVSYWMLFVDSKGLKHEKVQLSLILDEPLKKFNVRPNELQS